MHTYLRPGDGSPLQRLRLGVSPGEGSHHGDVILESFHEVFDIKYVLEFTAKMEIKHWPKQIYTYTECVRYLGSVQNDL